MQTELAQVRLEIEEIRAIRALRPDHAVLTVETLVLARREADLIRWLGWANEPVLSGVM